MNAIMHVWCRILGLRVLLLRLLVLILKLTSTNSELSPSIDLGYTRLQTGPTLPTRTQVLIYASDFFFLNVSAKMLFFYAKTRESIFRHD